MRATLIGAPAAALVLLFAAQAAATGVQWLPIGLQEALAQARAQGKIVVVDIHADWCGPCHRLDKEVFNRDDVASSLKGAIALKIDGEKGEGPALVKRYHVVGYPTILFIRPDGQEIDRIFGFLEAGAFRETASDYIAGRKTLSERQKTLKTNPKDHALRFEVGRRMIIRGQLDAALPLLAPIFGGDKSNALGFVPKIHHLLGKYGYLRGKKDYDKAISHLTALIKNFPNSPEAARAPQDLARAHHKKGDTRGAMKTFDAWIAADPKKVGRYNAVAWFCFQNNLELDKAIAIANKGLRLDPKADYLWDTLAELHFKAGHKKEAVAAIKKAIAVKPDDAYYKDQLKKFNR